MQCNCFNSSDKKAFFAMTTSKQGPLMYEFANTSTRQMKEWCKVVEEASNAAKELAKVKVNTVRYEIYMFLGGRSSCTVERCRTSSTKGHK